MTDELRQRFFATIKDRLRRCLEPKMECTADAIRAHSIQNANILDLLATEDHLISPTLKHSAAGPKVEFAKISRNQVSTFTGFCNYHDTQLFKCIDQWPIDLTSSEQLFLLAYRSVTRELHAVMEGASRIQYSYLYRVEHGYDSGTPSDSAGQIATSHLIKSYETYRYRCDYFDQFLLQRRYDGIAHDVIYLKNQIPVIAASATFSLDELASQRGTPRATLNIFPNSRDDTVAIFSYIKEDAGIVRTALERILHSTGDYQKYEMSKLMLSSMENFVISPAHVDNWSAEKRSLIRTEFERTLLGGSVVDDARLMLF